MHELHIMRHIIGLVEEACRSHGESQPSVIHLQVASHSHIASHTPDEMQAMFQMAAAGTIAEKARLAIALVSDSGHCQSCGAMVARTQDMLTCPLCESGIVTWGSVPEVLLKEVELAEPNL